MRFSLHERDRNLERLAQEPFDVLVIGGGITGAGVALDAVTRGLRTALVDRGDFAAGTSSRSSKLVHGGLRYLNQREFRLVYEALAERQRLLRLAPHLVRPLPFLIPGFGTGAGGRAGARAYARAVGAALWMYDMTGGMRIGKLHRRLSEQETLAHMPDLDPRHLAAGFLYYDARVDDARLTLAVAKTAAAEGAVAVNYVAATGAERAGAARITGVELTDGLTGRRLTVRPGVVVNAAGVWADEVAALDDAGQAPAIHPAKGVHITLPAGRPRLDIAAVLPVPGDRRSVFVIPWGDRVYVGTTDTDYDGSLDEPVCTAGDVDYLCGAVNTWVTEPVSPAEVVGAWAGLRPLVAGASAASAGRTADLSRRHAVRTSASGMVTIVGGKLTTYRRMAEEAVDAAGAVLEDGVRRRSRTGRVPIFGADGYKDVTATGAADRLGLPPAVLSHLAGRHGGQTPTVAAMVHEHPELAQPLVPGLPYLAAEALYAVRYEMALTLEDVLSRRTRALLLDDVAAAAAAPAVAGLLAPELGWDQAETDRQVTAFTALVERHRRRRDPAEDAVEAEVLARWPETPGRRAGPGNGR